ncbi:MAG: GspE/PulE family protein [bacterium]|nr:GspE/PulE family protein [bacterium]
MSESILKQIPSDFFQRNQLLLFSENPLTIGICPDSEQSAIEDIRLMTGKSIELVSITREQMESGLRDMMIADARQSGEAGNLSAGINGDETLDLAESGQDAPIIKLVNGIFMQAIQQRGTDIHIEPYETEAHARIRTDGELYDSVKMTKSQYTGVCARIKVMSKLNLAESRLPQDGRMRVKSGTRIIDVRVSLLPVQFGERIVLRILDRSSKLITLEELGLLRNDYEAVNGMISRPYGSILVTGPTGSGKSTTLYAMIEKIKSPRRNIITVEDPVEYQIDGIGQVPVNSKTGLTFACGLRSILRQDPDVIMVGEIRDPETADIVTHASLTGHLVLSTLHTNDAPTAVSRLVDMGVEKYLISSSLLGVMAQRLVKTLCPKCAKPYTPEVSELKAAGWDSLPKGASFKQAAGCPECMNSGYRGRRAIFEVMKIDEELRSEITRTSDSNTIRDIAKRNGMRSLLEDGREKAAMGFTTLSEIAKSTKA